MMNNRKKPKFLRQEWYRKPGLGKKWRSPKGNQSKLRRHIKNKGFIPSAGYGSPAEIKGMHPCGLREIVVSNVADLEGVEKERQAAKIASGVGRKKREIIIKKAQEMGIRVLNAAKAERKKVESKKKEKKESKQTETKQEEHKAEKKEV
ncbi:MAG: 50S ribosomal protein L32e [Candidatus Aenigmatarchaeota archaeon]